jgi:hypothetical protein
MLLLVLLVYTCYVFVCSSFDGVSTQQTGLSFLMSSSLVKDFILEN